MKPFIKKKDNVKADSQKFFVLLLGSRNNRQGGCPHAREHAHSWGPVGKILCPPPPLPGRLHSTLVCFYPELFPAAHWEACLLPPLLSSPQLTLGLPGSAGGVSFSPKFGDYTFQRGFYHLTLLSLLPPSVQRLAAFFMPWGTEYLE